MIYATKAILRLRLTKFCRFALAKAEAFWHRADELGQGCCPILAAKAEDALRVLTMSGFRAIVTRSMSLSALRAGGNAAVE
ncbi:hypothetical protein RTCIAT899_CH15160 [Rhizobium tropici CIAT 899]|nr:hypothetical protein RTCIAT899_CH15160 [Rhizobium tropici CIAT 899]